jgi:glucosamine-6-phosphate deaminase
VTLELDVRPSAGWADVVADRFLDRLHRRPTQRVCLPTGDTPRPIYRRLADRRADLSRTTVILLDEFLGLPPGDPARCDVMIARDLLDLLPAPPGRLLRLDPDDEDPDAAAQRFDAEVTDGGIDLALVGLGANGHVGMNEPGSGPGSPTRVVALHAETLAGAMHRYGAGREPTGGMTLGLAPLLTARELWLLVTGRHKAAMLQRVLEGAQTDELPATWLRSHPALVVFADEGAATMLSRVG